MGLELRASNLYEAGLVVGSPDAWQGSAMSENMLQNSAAQADASTQDDVHYEMRFTRDAALIAEYKALRKRLYGIDRRFIGFREFSDSDAENYNDPDDQMLILHDGNRVYGGACLRVSTPKRPIILNSEQDIMPPPGKFYFSLKEHLPELELDKYAYSEFVRIVVDPSLRKGLALKQLYLAALQRCIDYRVRYMFGIADKVRARLYKQIYGGVGMDGGTVNKIAIPMREEYEGVKMDLICIDMLKCFVTAEDPDCSCLLQPIEEFQFT